MFMDKLGNISMNSPHRGSIGWDSTCAVCAPAGAMQASNRRRRLLVSCRQAGSRLSTLPHLAFASLRSHSLAKAAAAEKAPCLHLPPAAVWCFFPRRSIHYRSRSNPIYAKNMSPHFVGAHIFGGQGGIRTHEPIAGLPDFECCKTLADSRLEQDFSGRFVKCRKPRHRKGLRTFRPVSARADLNRPRVQIKP